MVYHIPAPETVFTVNGFWVHEIRGVVALSYTDTQERALRFPTSKAAEWHEILNDMAAMGFEVNRVDLPPKTSVDIVPLCDSAR